MGKAARRRAAQQRAVVESEQDVGDLYEDAVLRDMSRTAFNTFTRGLDEQPGVRAQKVGSPYAQLITVFRGIRLIANAMKRVPFRLFRGEEPVIDGPLVELFRKPNAAMHWGKFLGTAVVQWHSGNAYMRLGDRGRLGLPRVIELLPPARVQPKRAKGADTADPTALEGWLFNMGAGKRPKEISVNDLVRWEYAESDDPFVGLSCFAPARLALDTEYLAGVYQKATLQNGGTPGSILTHKGATRISKVDRQRAKGEWKREFGPAHAGSPVALLSGDWAYQNLGFTPRDMQFLNLRNWSIGEFARMLNIPPLYLAYFETSGLSDAGLKVQERLFYNQCIIPACSELALLLNEYVIRPFDASIEGVFDFSEVEALRADLAALVAIAEALDRLNVPVSAINELLQLGIPDIDKYPWLFEKIIMSGQTTARVTVERANLDDEPVQQQPGIVPGQTTDQVVQDAKAEDAADAKAQQESQQDREDELDQVGRSAEAEAVADAAFDALLTSALNDAADRLVYAEDEIAWATRAMKLTKRQRVAVVRTVNEAARPIIDQIDRRVVGVMKRQKKAVRDALLKASGTSKRAFLAQELGAHGRAVGDDPIDLTPRDIESILGLIQPGTVAEAITPDMRAAYKAGNATLRDVLIDMGVTQADFTAFQRDRLPLLVDGYVDARLGTGLPTRVDDTTRALVNSVIVTNLESGGTLADTMKGINAVFRASLSRARTIARTETTIALNAGRFETMKESSQVSHHMWITAGDRHVRGMDDDDDFTHVKLHGRVVPVGDSFASDDDLKFPGDPDAEAGNSINCRCTTAPVSERRLGGTADDAIGSTATRVG